MSFNLFVKLESGDTESRIGGIETGLNKTSDAAGKARDAMGRFVKTGTEGAAATAKAVDEAAKSVDRAGSAAATAGRRAAAGHAQAQTAAHGHGDALSNLIHLAEAYVAVHQVKEIIDGYIEIRNKTNSVATSQANLNALMDEQFRIAQETRSSWEDLAGAYQRIANASRGLGLSQRQVLDMTEEISMGMRLSGASSREAAITMMELTHAFTVGALTGREYKVIAKDAPAFLHEIQVASGKTAAEFAEMGKSSKISAELLTQWLGKAAPEIREKFAQMIPTISEGFTLIHNAAEKFFGEAGVGSGVVQTLGNAMRFLADHMETIGKVALATGEALVSLFVIEKITTMIKSMTIALAENPLTALLVALTVGIALLRQFGDQMETTTKTGTGVVTIADTMGAAWDEIKKLAHDVIGVIEDAIESWRRLFGGAVDTGSVEKSTMTVTDLIDKMVTGSIGLLHFLGDTVVTIFGGIPLSIGEMFTNMAKAVAHTIEVMINGIISGINKLLEAKNYLAGLAGDGPAMVADPQKLAAEAWAKAQNQKYNLGGPTGYNPLGIGMTADEVAARRSAQLSNAAGARSAGLPAGASSFTPEMAPGGGGGLTAGNLIAPIDLGFTTALDGAAEAFDRKIKDDWEKDVTDGIAAVGDAALKKAQQRQFDAIIKGFADAAHPDGISTVGGKADAKIVDEKAAAKAEKAFEKLENQLRAVTEASNPQAEAVEKLSHAHEVLFRAVNAVNPKTHEHILTVQEATRVYDLYARKLEDQIHPFDAWISKQKEATDALKATSEETERAAKLKVFVDEMKQKTGGVGASSTEIALAEKQIAIDQKRGEIMKAEQGFTTQILGPQRAYQANLVALGDLLEHGYLTSTQYARAVAGVREAYLNADPEILTTQQRIEAAWLKAKADAAAAGVAVESYSSVVDKVRAQQIAAGPEGKTFLGGLEAAWLKAKAAAEGFGATVANTLVGDVDKLNESIISAANGGTVAWGQMVDAWIQDLERLIMKQLEVNAFNAIVSSFTTGAGAAADIAGVVPGINGPITSPSQVARIAPGAYPQPAQSGARAAAATAAPAVTLEVHNHYDKSVVYDAMDSSQGRKIVVNHMRAEQPAIRSFSGIRK